MPAELKIILDSARYRIERLEMANLVAAIAVMLALRLSVDELVVRVVFGVLLNLFVYLNNDWLDLADDLASFTRDRAKTEFLAAHRAAAVRAQVGLFGLLIAIAMWHGAGLIWPLVLGAGICWAYTAKFKHRPYADVLAMIAWGVAMPLVGVPPGHAAGWPLLGQLALFSGVFETIQIMRDHDHDARRGIRTTAVVLGPARTSTLARWLLVASAIYAGAVFHPLLMVLPLVASTASVPQSDLDGYWTRVRLLLGPTFILECVLAYMGGFG